MSCSRITEVADEEQEDEEADDTLVVVVKPDGTVTIDQEIFNRVLENKKETMNIIHFENSSNTGITTNPENGEPEINLTVQGFYPSISTQTFLSQANENSDMATANTIYLDHCYYKDCPPNTSENISDSQNTLSTGTQHITNKLKKSNTVNKNEEIEEITVSMDDCNFNNSLCVVLEDIKSAMPSIIPNNIPESNLPNNKRMLNLRVGKNEKPRNKGPISLKNTITKKKPVEIQSSQSGDKARITKTVKRLLPTTYQVRPPVQIKNNRQKKSDVIVDNVFLQANELIRQSSIEPKKYIQNQLMFKKNKDKIGIESSLDSSTTLHKHVSKLLDVPELFSSPDVILDDNKTSIQTENVELDPKIIVIDKIDEITSKDNLVSDSKDLDQMIVNKEETGRVRKVSNRTKDNPVEITVTKTVEDILNDISSKIANQTEIIDEENLIDELADLNEDLNSSNFVAPSNSSHDLMNKLLSDDSLNQSDNNDSITLGTDDKSKGPTVVVYGKSGRIVTLPPIEIPKTRSLVKKENLDASIKEQGRQRRSSENSRSINDYSEESDTDREGNMTSEDDPNRLWCVCRKPHNNRFMICCDTCEDWFHGKCVGITKALGEQMEARGVEWNCPPCKKKRTEDARKKSEEDKVNKKLEEEKKKLLSSKSSVKKNEVIKIQPQLQQKCAQCDKIIEGVAVGLFCNEVCLDQHIEESVAAIKACCTSDSPDIIFLDKKNSRLITGEQAPKIANIKQWMKENPAFEILKPGSKYNLNKTSIKSQSNSKPIPNPFKNPKRDNENCLKRPATSPDKHKAKEIKKDFDVSELLQPDKIKLVFVKKDLSKPILPQKEPIKHTTPQKEPIKHTTPQKEPIKHTTPLKEPIKHIIPKKEPIKHTIPQKEVSKCVQPVTQIKTTSISKTNVVQKVVKKKPELVKKIESIKEIFNEKKGEAQLRTNVRKSLLESLSSRISEEPELKTAEQNLEELISKIEEELYNQFSKVDQKYKTKYRSLLFNIKDPKNLNFFKKIIFKWVTPYQLVRMTADEMASQELAEWRERENKHQIEMIRKTELDMMNQPKALLMKTHKGEEIIESKDNKETIVSELNPDIKVEEKKPQILLKLTKEKKKSKYKDSSSNVERERRHHKSSRNRHKTHKDKKRRSRDRSKSRDTKNKKVEKNKVIESAVELVTNNIKVRKDEDISDREPSSTVVIATPPRVEEEVGPIWKGTINFTDVARCSVTMSRLSGNVIGLEAELNLTVLECVGRIKQQTVWEYMGKLKKTGTKDIIVTKLVSSGMEQQMSYLSLYQYLSAKNRIAVIDSKPFPNIKDFYLFPLGCHSPIPQVLLPLDGPGIDDYRTHLLLGIIVRNSKKHWVPSWKSSENNYVLPDINDTLALPHLKPAFQKSSQDSYSPKESYTPPRSPTNKILSLPTPVLPISSVLTDDDLPYIPGEEEPYSPVDEDVPSLSDDINATSSIHQQMEELTRKIEKEKLVIQMMTAGSQNSVLIDDESLDPDEEVYSPTSELVPLTSEIQLPSNIKDILSSINTKELLSNEAENSKTTADVEKKCRDPRQRTSTAEPPPPGLEDEFTPPCNPDISLPPPHFSTPYMQPINYIAPIPYPYPPPGYIPDAYPNQYGPQQPPPPPPPMVLDQGKYNNYNQPGYAYNTVQYQPPLPPPYPKNKKGSGFWGHGSSKNEPKKKKFKKSGDRRDKGSWRRM
ncbi:PHD finger protein 3 isoform X2 [Rhopalosiphum maidis]|uniref:PHD finger protein 3 isoform X2 n=1 Tax=Rhopalosiphum maidis TaxID=43146 RepID=UPI000F009217|nr:PHD finger protein 3 isoform X2 [Rhopalosiphum maidis]